MSAKRAASTKGRQQKSKSRKNTFNAQREAIKFLAFTQVVLYLAGGALPGHLRIFTLTPLIILTGAGALRLLSLLFDWLHEKNRATVKKSTPAVRPQPSPVPAKVATARVA